MAIVIIISGMMLAAFVKLYAIQQSQKKYDQTVENIAILQDLLNEYYGTYGRYPCPANPQLSINAAGYGIQQCRTPAEVDTLPCSSATPNIPAGLDCENFGGRDVDGDGLNEEIMIGSIPITQIATDLPNANFNKLAAIDGYGNKFTYAVTEKMTKTNITSTTPAHPQSGGIRIVDENRRQVTTPPSSAHYVLFSHGENEEGAYNKQGALVQSCFVSLAVLPPFPVPAPGAAYVPGIKTDIENCDNNDAAFIKGAYSLANNDNYYDDIFGYRASNTIPIWNRSSFGGSQMWLYNANLGGVGVNTQNPSTPLEVNGNVIAELSAQAEVGFCDPSRPTSSSTTQCLKPDFIGGSGDACPSGQIAYGIERNTLLCKDIFNAATSFNFDCGVGFVATGITMNFTTNSLTATSCDPI
jgi:type II secretory pathway pseudopilin PulG